jgi:hypothetical protein
MKNLKYKIVNVKGGAGTSKYFYLYTIIKKYNKPGINLES